MTHALLTALNRKGALDARYQMTQGEEMMQIKTDASRPGF